MGNLATLTVTRGRGYKTVVGGVESLSIPPPEYPFDEGFLREFGYILIGTRSRPSVGILKTLIKTGKTAKFSIRFPVVGETKDAEIEFSGAVLDYKGSKGKTPPLFKI